MSVHAPISQFASVKRQGNLPHVRFFLLIAPFLYAAFALLSPPFQTPDEHQHLFRAWQLSELHLIAERRGPALGGVLPGGIEIAAAPEIGTVDPHALRPPPKRPLTMTRSTSPDAAPPRFYNFFGSAIYSPAGYGPQVLAVWVGKSAGLSVENIVRLGRLFNAAFAIALIAAAIALTPWGASVFLFVGLFPMTVATASALGQDGLINGGACLLTALGLRAAASRRWTLQSQAGAFLLLCALTLSKIVYLPLALVGGLPRREKPLREVGLLFICCLVPAVLAVWWVSATNAVKVDHFAHVPHAGERVASWLADPSLLVAPLLSAFAGLPRLMQQTLFTFGWLNIGPIMPAQALSAAALLCLFLGGGTEQGEPGAAMRLRLIVVSFGIAIAICLALLLTYTPVDMAGVNGLQGRYFIPSACLLLLALLPARSFVASAGVHLKTLLIGANLVVLIVIAKAFYTL